MKGDLKHRNLQIINAYYQVMQVKDSIGETHELMLEIVDIPGGQSVHNVANWYLENTKVAILCYAINDRRSYEDINAWIDHIKDKEGLFSVILGNKSDLCAVREIPLIILKRL